MGVEPLNNAEQFVDRDMEAPVLFDVGPGTAAIISMRCPGSTTENEDSATVVKLPNGSVVLAVADGVGGGARGHHASSTATAELLNALNKPRDEDWSVRSAIIDAFENANAKVIELAAGAATTLCAVEIAGNELRPYYAGDSVILIIGGRGRIKYQSVAHSPTGYAVESGMMDEKEAIHHEERHVVSNVIGSSDMHIDVGGNYRLAPRDTVVLASDGLVDNLHTNEIAQLIRRGKLADAVTRLAGIARDRMTKPVEGKPSKPDDLSIIAYRSKG